MELMNCQAVGIAPQDLGGGIPLLKQIQEKQHLNWVSMNLVDLKSKKPIFSPLVKTHVGSTKIAILGLTDDQQNPGPRKTYALLSWKDTLPKYVAEAAKESDMVLLLSSYPESVNREIARSVDGIDLILESSRHPSGNLNPLKIKNTLLAHVETRGKYLGMMRIHWTDTGKWGLDLARQIRKKQNKLDRIKWQIGRMEKNKQTAELKDNPLYLNLLTDRETFQKEILVLQKEKAAGISDPCSFSNQFIGLRSSMPDDKEVQAIIDHTTREVNSLNKKRKHSSVDRQPSALKKLAGSQVCKECHPLQMAFWQETQHVRAWQTLVQDDQQFNEDCVVCHVTLPYYDLARVKKEQLLVHLPEKLQKVGCESCHGIAAAHTMNPESAHLDSPNEATCLQCHTQEHDDNFIYTEKVEKIRCPKG